MARRRPLPPIPAEAFSVLGSAVPVRLKKDLLDTEEAHGYFSQFERTIDIDNSDGVSLDNQWQSYWHEVTHLAIWDAGIHGVLAEDSEELVCNVMGTYLTAMMRAGYLKVPKPRTSTQLC